MVHAMVCKVVVCEQLLEVFAETRSLFGNRAADKHSGSGPWDDKFKYLFSNYCN